ncbi:MAG: plasmid pRiA4b ORF-3 family protein [Micrococcales bacterium]|nr:plasmid pRiA4b ORF-3 family protein [Micrococcales bacterium]
MAKTWLSIRVELVCGRGGSLWPRPGRIFAAARRHTFADLATSINDAFARWDRSHLHEFTLANGRKIGCTLWIEDCDYELEDDSATTLGCLQAGEQFVFEFDFGDGWDHLCTVDEKRIDPLESLGIVPDKPLPYWGWGQIPDQYGRRWDEDDGESDPPPDPGLVDLPPLRRWWGPQAGRW